MTRSSKNVLVALTLLLGSGCSSSSPEGLELPQESIARLEQDLGYPRGGWWHNPQELMKVRLAARHILVSHRSVSGAQPLLGVLLWPGERSRDDALRRATAIARQAAAQPESFAQLARSYSDDQASARVGGALGVFSPLAVPRSMVDALGALSVGAVSKVFQSELGFHVVQRLAAPKRERLSYARIVVAHQQGSTPSSKASARTRRAAAERAAHLFYELKAAPQRFAEVAQVSSDAPDKARAGDQGSYDTYEYGAPALVLQLVSKLDIGQVSEPIETEEGFEILQRTAERPRTRYAYREMTFPYAGSGLPVLGATATKEEARKAGEEIVRAMRGGMGFDQARTELCKPPGCQFLTGVETEGRGAPELEPTLLALAPGMVAESLLSSRFGFHLVRREAGPPAATSDAVRFDLPAAPTFEEMIGSASPMQLAAATRRIGREATLALKIQEPAVLGLFEELAARFEREGPDNRLAQLHETRLKLRQLVGEEDAARIAAFVRRGGATSAAAAPGASSHGTQP